MAAPLVEGFDWDDSNRSKCMKHGLSVAEVEAVFRGPPLTGPDTKHSHEEERHWVIGRSQAGRWVFAVFTLRDRGGKKLIQPISARYMHRKEMRHYEEENPGV